MTTVVLDVRGLRRGSEQNVVDAVLGRRPGVLDVSVNPVAQAATVVYDPSPAGGPGPGPYPLRMCSAAWPRSQEAFAQAASWFVRTTARVEGRWQEAALGEWTVRDLVGHTSRSLLTVETYLAQPVAEVAVTSPADYFRLVMELATDDASVAQRGRDAGAALGSDVPTAIERIAERVLAKVGAAEAGDLVATPVGGMRLGDYLPTRTFELTVHTCDLAAVLGQAIEVPEGAAIESLSVLGALAVRRGAAGPLLRAATGRGALPEHFTVL